MSLPFDGKPAHVTDFDVAVAALGGRMNNDRLFFNPSDDVLVSQPISADALVSVLESALADGEWAELGLLNVGFNERSPSGCKVSRVQIANSLDLKTSSLNTTSIFFTSTSSVFRKHDALRSYVSQFDFVSSLRALLEAELADSSSVSGIRTAPLHGKYASFDRGLRAECQRTRLLLGLMLMLSSDKDWNGGKTIVGAAALAVEEINRKGMLPNGTSLEFVVVDAGCLNSSKTKAALRELLNQQVVLKLSSRSNV